jgi:uncharacterized protein YndB with AHSA1/START domain/predicted enzyme related to lactoylglutathione lyase
MNMNDASANTVTVKRLIKAPRERVYAAWTNGAELMKWFGPATCRATSATLDVRTGGEYRIHISSERMGEVDLCGVYREVNPPLRLAFTWKWSGNPFLTFGETLVTVDFHAVEDGTDVHITHEQLPNAEVRDDHTYGWTGCLDKLQKELGVAEPEGPAFAVGSFCWNELLSTDMSASAGFYARLFDWQAVDFPMNGSQYSIFNKDGKQLAGLMAMPMPGVPPHWLAYVHVQDVDSSAQKATSLGGMVVRPPFDIPTVGRIAILQDPQGAVLGIFKPAASSPGKT